MTVHHDKLAYGKLARQQEELSRERIDEMIKLLNEENGREADKTSPEDKEKEKP